MHANLTGVVAGVNKTDSGVVVNVEFPVTDGKNSVISIPVAVEKAKALGLGTEVELLLKKKRKPRTKKDASAAPVVTAADVEVVAPRAPATRGRKRASAV